MMPASPHDHFDAMCDPRPVRWPALIVVATVLSLLAGCSASAPPAGKGYGVGAVPGDTLQAMLDRCRQVPDRASKLAAECDQLHRSMASQPSNVVGNPTDRKPTSSP